MTPKQTAIATELIGLYAQQSATIQEITHEAIGAVDEKDLDKVFREILCDTKGLYKYTGKLTLPVVMRYLKPYLEDKKADLIPMLDTIQKHRAEWMQEGKQVHADEAYQVIYKNEVIYTIDDLKKSLDNGNLNLEEILKNRIEVIDTLKKPEVLRLLELMPNEA